MSAIEGMQESAESVKSHVSAITAEAQAASPEKIIPILEQGITAIPENPFSKAGEIRLRRSIHFVATNVPGAVVRGNKDTTLAANAIGMLEILESLATQNLPVRSFDKFMRAVGSIQYKAILGEMLDELAEINDPNLYARGVNAIKNLKLSTEPSRDAAAKADIPLLSSLTLKRNSGEMSLKEIRTQVSNYLKAGRISRMAAKSYLENLVAKQEA